MKKNYLNLPINKKVTAANLNNRIFTEKHDISINLGEKFEIRKKQKTVPRCGRLEKNKKKISKIHQKII